MIRFFHEMFSGIDEQKKDNQSSTDKICDEIRFIHEMSNGMDEQRKKQKKRTGTK